MAREDNGLATPEQVAYGLSCLQKSFTDIDASYSQEAEASVRNFFGNGRTAIDVFNEMVRLQKQCLELKARNSFLQRQAEPRSVIDEYPPLTSKALDSATATIAELVRTVDYQRRQMDDASTVRDLYNHHDRCGSY